MNQFPESKLKVRFTDCDPFNHLNNASYIDYLITAREDHLLDNYGFDIYRYAMEKGVSWVVAQNRIAYLLPANLSETVLVRSCMLQWGEKEILVEMQMWDEQGKNLKALLWTTFVHYDLVKKRSAVHSEELTQIFSGLQVSPTVTVGFEERVEQLKKQADFDF
jgi:acyl-CoA thioester hydrolase